MTAKSACDLLETIDEARPLGQRLDLLIEFMLRSCELIRASLPGVAQHALEVGRRYWRGEGTSAELDDARVSCWKYLDSIGASIKTDDAAVCGTRAVICVLYSTLNDQDPPELGQWFLAMTKKVADI